MGDSQVDEGGTLTLIGVNNQSSHYLTIQNEEVFKEKISTLSKMEQKTAHLFLDKAISGEFKCKRDLENKIYIIYIYKNNTYQDPRLIQL